MTEVGTQSRLALQAAVSVSDRAGYAVADARVLADSNHTIVWLRPHPILAKVGRPSAEHLLLREHRVARALDELGAPVVPPLSGVEPTPDPDTALLVTLWPRLEHLGEDSADAADVGQSLREVHRALDRYDGELPSFLDKLEDARALLVDNARMSALDPDNRRLLRTAFDALFDELRSRRYAVRGLHGEPHGQNRLTTPAGVTWIDFEGACLGPVEWGSRLPARCVVGGVPATG